MIYYECNKIMIRNMVESDAIAFVAEYEGKNCEPYRECKNDDDLVLYLSKKL